ncbi:hypothetical protein M2302_005249 [Micromonospora sp. A200]|nr:hypothetical protein [Micromonospora sp. A200]
MGAQVARFHVQTGPEPLFVRVRQVFTDPRQLRLHGSHLRERTAGRDAPIDDLKRFESDAWELMLVEARTDTGRFVSTTWRRSYPDADWWVVVGFGDTVRTLYRASPGKSGRGDGIVIGGPLWDLANEVNAKLITDG